MPTFLASLSVHLESVRLQFLSRSSLSLITSDLASYLSLIAHLRQALARARKKAYTISVGKLNPAKLANFAEIECFVLVACPENSLVDAKVPSILYLASIPPVLSDQTSTSLGLLSTHRDTFRAATRAAAFPDVDWRVRARFRRGSHTWAPRPFTGR